MKTFTRWLLALLLVAAPAIAVVHTASANTELAPASRLVAPYITLEAGRNTFLLLANTSGVVLSNKSGTTGGVHIEFYNKSCSRNDIVQQLSERDIDQINIDSLIASAIFADSSKLGFADIDVRDTTLYTGNSQVAPSLRVNALTGVVLVADSTDDFAFSYPMAASLGSAASGAGGIIVTRNPAGTGAASQWTGRYEPFPSRLFVPIFYAEGADSAGSTVTGFLSLVSPADGNWHGGGTGTGAGAEAPGEVIAVAAGQNALQLSVIMWDGCERQRSFTPAGHTVMGTLDTLFPGGAALRSNWTTANCTSGGTGPGRDEQGSNEPLGWLDIGNSSSQCKGSATGCGVAGGGNPLRGMVGVFFSRSVGGSPSKKMGDNSRLWGDPSTRTGAPGITCAASSTAANGGGPSAVTPCVYNFNLSSAP